MTRHGLFACMIACGLLAAAPAKADFDIIRWNGSHFCQIWDNALPGRPAPADYIVVAERLATWADAWRELDALIRSRQCGW